MLSIILLVVFIALAIVVFFKFVKKTPTDIEENKGVRKEKKKDSFNAYFITDIQPRGNIKPLDNRIKTGDGYEVVLSIYGYPTQVSEHWLASLMNMPNTMATMDVATESIDESTTNLQKSLNENMDRVYNAKSIVDKIKAKEEYDQLTQLTRQISTNGEIIKLVKIRLYLHEPTVALLEDKIHEIHRDLKALKFQGTVFISEQKQEYLSMFEPYKEQLNYITAREGKGVPSTTLGASFHYNFSELKDPFGSYFGTTLTGGSVLFDAFHRDNFRKSYGGLVVGKMGSGKSTLLKKLLEDAIARGYKVRVIDVTGEFSTMANQLGGKIISSNGVDGMINLLQVYKTSDTEQSSFTNQISNLETIYRTLSPDATDDEVKEFKTLLNKLYNEKLDISQLSNDKRDRQRITEYDPEEYPIMSDFLDFVIAEATYCKENMDDPSNIEASPERFKRLDSIRLTITDLVMNYSELFNGHTTLESLHNEDLVIFNVRDLTEGSKNIFNAIMQSYMTLIWDNAMQLGSIQKHLYESGKIKSEEVKRYLVLVDEAHHFVNPRSTHLVDFFGKFTRESRKYFAGLWLATQNLSDMVPEGADSASLASIKSLFELLQYKVIMQQDSHAQTTLEETFKGQLSSSELSAIPFLKTGEAIMHISGVKNVRFVVHANEEELKRFSGGM